MLLPILNFFKFSRSSINKHGLKMIFNTCSQIIEFVLFASLRSRQISDLFSKCDQIRRKLRIWSYLLKQSVMENFIFCASTDNPS